MVPVPTFKSKIAPPLWILLFFALRALALRAETPQGKVVVWWEKNTVDPWGHCCEQTNAVIESDEEIASNVIGIAGNYFHGVALRSDGTIIKFGRLLGDMEPPDDVSNIMSITMAGDSTWGIRTNGTVVRLGDRDTYNVKATARLTNVTSITWAGFSKYLALRKDGTVMAINLESRGWPSAKLIGTNQPRLVRVQGKILNDVAALASKGDTPVVLKRDGSVFTLGYQTPGKPPVKPIFFKVEGVGVFEDIGTERGKTPFEYATADPVMIDGAPLTNVMSITGSLALKSNGIVVSWGGGEPVPSGLSNVTAITSGNLALKDDGTVVTLGGNPYSQASVPAGLSNVVQIASSGMFNMAITTGAIPASVFVVPHGRLEEMVRKVDLIFKGQVLSSEPARRLRFHDGGVIDLSRARFKVISVLQGEYTNDFVDYDYSSSEASGIFSSPVPLVYRFEPGQCYIVFAASLARQDQYSYYQVPDRTNNPTEFREIGDYEHPRDDGVIRTLDARPVEKDSLKEACWDEFNLLLHDVEPSNQLYAIEHLDGMSKVGNDQGSHRADFKRPRVLQALRPFITSTNDKVAAAALRCFPVDAAGHGQTNSPAK